MTTAKIAPGRPTTGDKIEIRLHPDVIAWLDDPATALRFELRMSAKATRVSRATVARSIIDTQYMLCYVEQREAAKAARLAVVKEEDDYGV